MTLEAILAASPLFAGLDRRQRERLARRMTIRSFDPGTMILRQGTSGVAFYLILDGEVEVAHTVDEEGGASTALATLGPGDAFGEMALLDDGARSSSVTARATTQCALLSRWEFHEELRRSPELAIKLLASLSRRIRLLDERLARHEGTRLVEWQRDR
jgi:CRP/FNR family transcriptional regulator, cyclic AMP receptor protein